MFLNIFLDRKIFKYGSLWDNNYKNIELFYVILKFIYLLWL